MTREEAIETIRRCCPRVGDSQCYFETAIRELIPELKESEDERIRKAIVRLIEDLLQSDKFFDGISLTDMLAYLEKQKERKQIEWSEEDEIRRESCMLYLANTRDGIEFSQYIGNNARESGKKEIQKDIDWLKSLSPQPKPKPEVKHIGWVARDSKHDSYLGLGLVLFKGKPIRSGDCWTGVIDSQLPWESFPDLKWEDEPLEVEVEVTIRKKVANEINTNK